MLEPTMRQIAASQHGLVRLDQLVQLGASPGARRHLVDSGVLDQLSVSVFRVAGAPQSLAQRRMAAVLDAGVDAVLSHDAAAEAWGLTRRPRASFDVARRRRVTPRSSHLGSVHVVRDLQAHHVVRRNGIPTTTPARSVVDLAATTYPDRVERLLDAAWSRRLLNIGELASIVWEVRKKGRAGVVLLDQLVAQRWNRPRPGSALELRYEDILRRHGLPPMRPQVHLHDDEGWIGCVDYVGVDVPLVVFVDGAAFHTSLTDQRHDDLQTRRIQALGYHVERISDAQILFTELEIVRRLRPLLLVRDRAA
jgi:putative AbiEi antitoxin of type IV toxin-antitoxin system